ncbi:MAG TPA: HNH endonuclease signature motif containing protein, partial [Kribbella sp.]
PDDRDHEPVDDTDYDTGVSTGPYGGPSDDLGGNSARSDDAAPQLQANDQGTGAAAGPHGDALDGDALDGDALDGDALDGDAVEEAAQVGADATVVIHATGAELQALINGTEGTGGEADHHGPIPQSSLRKHLIKALTHTLLPNLPTIPNSPRPGAATHRPRTTTDTCSGHDGCCGNDSNDLSGVSGADRGSDADRGGGVSVGNGPSGASSGGGSARTGPRIEVRITDQPPGSDPNKYTPSAALDRYVRFRDRVCQFPGCNRPAEFTDLDHRDAFAAGGRTTATNLWCLCRHHHRLKHEGGWQTRPNPDGSYTWTSPTGRQYRNNPTTTDPPPTRAP